ncbi:MAG: hypothetical protein ACRD1E_07245, partial [Terriglobales bacterium]
AETPVLTYKYRHVPIQPAARILTIIGLTGDNTPVGFAIGGVDDDIPDLMVVTGEPRDPALTVLTAAALADSLEPLLAAETGGAGPAQILVDGPNTIGFLHAWTFRMRAPWLPGPYAADARLAAAAERKAQFAAQGAPSRRPSKRDRRQIHRFRRRET